MKKISDIKKMERCEKLFWLSKKQPQTFSPYVFYNEDIYELTKKKLGIIDCFVGKSTDNNDTFFSCEKDYKVFMKVYFTYKGLQIRIPLMIRKRKNYEIYFLYASCYPKEHDAQLFADQLWVLEQLGIKVSKIKVIHLNSEYIRKDELDVNELLIVNEYLYNEKNHQGQEIKVLVKEKTRDLNEILEKMDAILAMEHIEKERTNICTRRNKCPYFDTCFATPNSDTSIMNLVSCSTKFKLLDEGKTDISMIDIEDVEGTRHQFAQILAAKTNKLVFDTYAVESFFENVSYPISYLDFEWETYAYPPFKEMKPFDVLTFQYSLHVEEKNGSLTHYEYLGKKDCRVEFIEKLISEVPKEGSVMCFNVEGAEKLRLKQLAAQFPQYKEDLENIWTRMIDLSIPFSTGLIYDNRLAGMYSLKKLVAIFTDYNYADLDISHGVEAVRNYRHMDEKDGETQKEILRELLEYCAMDTYAEYLIYHWILDKITYYKEENKKFRKQV